MICPNCGTIYLENETYCPACQIPLSNATYTPLRKKSHKLRNAFLILLFLMSILGAGSFYGYDAYKKASSRSCQALAEDLLSSASTLDLSKLASEQLPEDFKNEAGAKELLHSYINQSMEDQGLTQMIENEDLKMDYDSLDSKIQNTASYTVDDVSIFLNKCTVTVSTSNLNYKNIIREVKEDLPSKSEEETDTEENASQDQGWWHSITHWVSDFLDEEEAEDKSYASDDLITMIEEHTAEKKTESISGKLTYQYDISSQKWILISADSNLFQNLYGFPQS